MSLGLPKAGCSDANYAVTKYCTHTGGSHSEDCVCGVATPYVKNRVGVMQHPWKVPVTVEEPGPYSDNGSSFHVV